MGSLNRTLKQIRMKLLLACMLVAYTSAVILEREPFKRLIPADRLRDFQNSCFASTKCKVYNPGETWSLAPFCGASKCVLLKSGRLAEEVTTWLIPHILGNHINLLIIRIFGEILRWQEKHFKHQFTICE